MITLRLIRCEEMKNTNANIFKKSFRIYNKFLLVSFIKIIYPMFKVLGISIYPPYNKINNFEYIYSNETRRLVFNVKEKQITDFEVVPKW